MLIWVIVKSLQLCPTLCDPIDGSPPGSPIPGFLQARTVEWVAISFSNAWKWKMKVKSESEVAQSYPTLSDPTDCSLPGSSVHGIFQARVLEWDAIRLFFCSSNIYWLFTIRHALFWAWYLYSFVLNGNLLHCSCLENPRDGGAWWAAVSGVAQSRIRPKWLNSNSIPIPWVLGPILWLLFPASIWA